MSTIATQTQVSINSIVSAGRDQVSADLANEAVVLDLKSGTYFGLNPVGARVWQLLQSPRPIHVVRDVILDEYEVEPARCEQDILDLLNDMAARGLIEVWS